MNMELPASPAPPSPIAPIEPGPHEPNAVFASNRAQPLLEEASSSTHVSKQDLERAILIECTELYVLVVEGDWRGLASLGLAMDLKVIERTHDPRFDPEIKEIAQKGVKHLHRTHRARITQNISAAYTTIPASLLGKYLGFPEIEQEALQRCTKPTSTHLGFNDLNYLTASALALDTPL
ncbi:hypothetical protein QFC21_004435 [Naganishia friedmannii]|uniref:Uncharacterized protein n=1 Tax=Naganishia friedmannii TaxID=89922 RepID=A0ACC2VG89_9TREE|nr:hypothetical protein QFC21_004435 [Naganishia friedmannii]